MTRTMRTSRKQDAKTGVAQATAVARVDETGNERQYAAAFARLRLVRGWVAVAAAIVTVLSTCLTLMERCAK